jgi:hypothetical protein
MKVLSVFLRLGLVLGTGLAPSLAAPVFFKGVNLNGPAIAIEGNPWLSHAEAQAQGLSFANASTWSGSYPFELSPAADTGVKTMLQSVLWRGSTFTGQSFNLSWKLGNGTYQLYLWTIENYQSNYRSMDVRIEGSIVATGVGDLKVGEWRKYGPYTAVVQDGVLQIDILRGAKGDPCLAGVALFSESATVTPPVEPQTPPSPATGTTFFRGINMNGSAVAIEGNQWLSYNSALQNGFGHSASWSGSGPLRSAAIPAVDAATLGMIQTVLWRSAPQGQGINMTQTVNNGSYDVYVWMVEDYLSNYRSMDLRLEGVTVATGLGDLPVYNWRKYGPYRTSVVDGVLNIDVLRGYKGDVSISGLSIRAVNTGTGTAGNQAPSVSLSAPANNASYTAPASIPLSAVASDADGSVSKVEFFANGTLVGTSLGAPWSFVWNGAGAGTYALTARATDNVGATSVSQTVNIAVNATTAVPPTGGTVVLVSDFGAVGNGVVDDSYAIQRAVDSVPLNATLDFGSGKTYLIGHTVDLSPNRTYKGTSTLKLSPNAIPGSAIARFPYGEAENATVSGLTFDGSGIGALLRLASDGISGIPARNLKILNCSFRNSRPGGNQSDAALYAPVGLQNSEISGNRFFSCSTCILVNNPNYVTISNNDIDTVTGGNAISINVYDLSFEYGNGLVISGNTGRNFSRMAVEIWGAGGKYMNAPVISGNRFEGWANAKSSDPFGISVVIGQGAKILNNVISGGFSHYAIEVGVPGAVIQGNTITGFPLGVAVLAQPDVTVEGNTLNNQTDTAIVLSNANPNGNPRARILNNVINNPKNFGIGMIPNNFGGAVISGNKVYRQGGFWSDDAGRQFVGIKIDDGFRAPITVSQNTVVQTAANPPAGFGFWGFGIYGKYSGSVYDRNTVESKSASPNGIGMLLWYLPFLDDSTVSNSQFTNLSRVTNGFTSSRVKAFQNAACRVTTIDPFIGTTVYCPF